MSSTECYPDKAPEANALLETLSHHLRREVIHYFENHVRGNTAEFDELVAHIEHRIPKRDGEKLSTELWHCHLPKLEDDGWVELDHRSKTIRYHGDKGSASLLAEVLEIFTD